jgi:hypothetical protein
MNKIKKRKEFFKKYFEKKRDDIFFITIKKGASVKFKNLEYVTEKEMPVPVRAEKLLDDIKDQDDNEGITINNIIDGIIFIQGTDKTFSYLMDYHNMLNKLNFELSPYIMLCINKFDDNNDDAVIYGKALLNIYENEKSCFVMMGYRNINLNLLTRRI